MISLQVSWKPQHCYFTDETWQLFVANPFTINIWHTFNSNASFSLWLISVLFTTVVTSSTSAVAARLSATVVTSSTSAVAARLSAAVVTSSTPSASASTSAVTAICGWVAHYDDCSNFLARDFYWSSQMSTNPIANNTKTSKMRFAP